MQRIPVYKLPEVTEFIRTLTPIGAFILINKSPKNVFDLRDRLLLVTDTRTLLKSFFDPIFS